MKFLEKGIYKIFEAVVLVSMIGALVAEPVALGDVGGLYYQYCLKDINAANSCYNQAFWASFEGTIACIPLMFCGGVGVAAMAGVVTYSTVVL